MDYFYRNVISHVISAITELEDAECSCISLTLNEVDRDEFQREFRDELDEHLPENHQIIGCNRFKCLLRVNELYYIIAYSLYYDDNCEDYDEVNVSMMIKKYNNDIDAFNWYNSI